MNVTDERDTPVESSPEDRAAAAASGARIVDGGTCSIGCAQPGYIVPAPGVFPDEPTSFQGGIKQYSDATVAAYSIAEACGTQVAMPLRKVQALAHAFGAFARDQESSRRS